MSGFALRAALGLAAIGLAFPAGAQQPAPPKTVWNLAWIEEQCAIRTGSPDTLAFALLVRPGDPNPAIHLAGNRTILPGKLPATVGVVLQPGGQTFREKAWMRTNSSGRREIGVPKVSTEFLAAFAKAEEIQFVMPGNTISVPVRGAGKAAAALEQCLVQKLPEWGIDPTTYLALRRPPVTVDGDVLIAGEEYPGVSIQNNEQGIVIARLGVDASGKVTSCAVLVSSNSSNLDRATCTIAVIRWKFHPAIGADGKPTAAPRVIGVEFRLEDSTRPDLFRGMFKD